MENLTGKQFGSYQIVGPLGEGGMATVYKAYQPAMERYVALKVLPRYFANDPEFVARFEREAKVLARLQHPHILPVFDYGRSDDYTYLVMPFVESGTLTSLMKGQPLAPQRIRQIISQLADALNYAHQHGLIHRDVKPSNVLVDEGGNCLLTDFGLAHMTESSLNLTTSGTIVGTPAYMSPEQGSGQKIDARSDIYSLGVILYEMATGRVPYKAETPVAVVFKHIQDPLPPAREVNPNISPSIETVILKSLSKRPDDRYQTAADMARAIQIAIPESSQPAPPISPPTIPPPTPVSATYASVPVSKPISTPRRQPDSVPISSVSRPSKQAMSPWVVGTIIFIVFGLIIVVIGGLAVSGYFVYQGVQVNNTATAVAIAQANAQATEQAQASATAAEATAAAELANAQLTEQAHAAETATAEYTPASSYDFFDDFSNNDNQWITGEADTDYWRGTYDVKNGFYIWDVLETKQPFITWGTYETQSSLKDFDVTVDARRDQGANNEVCYGLLFREAPTTNGFDDGAYTFSVCDSQQFSVHFHSSQTDWVALIDWTNELSIKPDEWNTLAISARGDNFTFSINGKQVGTVTDSRSPEGYISAYIDIYEKVPATVRFDNFSLSVR